MSIPEYYLHMFAGTNGDHDQYTGAGRVAIAALMAGYGLQSTTKRDLQTRVGWETTPGCFLGQKELSPESYSVRNRQSLVFVTQLLLVKKAARTLNYTLNWNTLNGDHAFDVCSPIWPMLARIYFMGRFMFGRNVIPAEAMQILRDRFNYTVQGNDHSNVHSPYVVQFFCDMGFFAERVPNYVEGSCLPASVAEASVLRLPRRDVFLSFASAMNYSENAAGFYACAAAIPSVVPDRTSFRNIGESFRQFESGRSGDERRHRGPMMGNYYDYYTLGAPSITLLTSPNRTTTNPRDIVALFFADRTMTPHEEMQNGHSGRIARVFNRDYVGRNWASYVTAAMLYEFYLLLTGEEIVPLAYMIQARETLGIENEVLIGNAPSMQTLSNRNSTLSRLVKFHLERQNQV